MTDKMSLNNVDLSNYEFKASDISNDKFQGLLNKTGEITIDDEGKFTVINPSQKRDNSFVRFFKGIFSKEYRQQQASIDRLLDRLSTLRENAHYNEMIKTHAKNYAQRMFDFGHLELTDKINNQLDKLLNPQTGGIRVEKIRTTVDLNRTIGSTTSNIIDNIVNKESSLSKVIINGKCISLNDFIDKFGKNTDKVNFKDYLTNLINNAMLSSDDSLIPEEAAKLKNLISKNSLKSSEINRVEELMIRIFSVHTKKIAEFIQNALEKENPNNIAVYVQNNLNEIANAEDGVFEIGKFFGEKGVFSAEKDIKVSQDDLNKINKEVTVEKSELYNKNFNLIKTNLPGLKENQIASVIATYENDEESISKLVTHLNKLKESNSDTPNYNPISTLKELFDNLLTDFEKDDMKSAMKNAQTLTELVSKSKLPGEGVLDNQGIMNDFIVLYTSLNRQTSYKAYSNIKDVFSTQVQNVITDLDQYLRDKHATPAENQYMLDLNTLRHFASSISEITIPQAIGTTLRPDDVNSAGKIQEEKLETLFLLNTNDNLPDVVNTVNNKIPEGKRGKLLPLIIELVKSHVGMYGLVDQYGQQLTLQKIVSMYCDKVNKESDLQELLFKPLKKDHLKKVAPHIVNHLKKEVANDFKKKRMDENGIHTSLKNDVDRYFVKQFNGVDLTKIPQNEVFNTFIKELNNSNIPQEFFGFITFSLMQGGIGAYRQVSVVEQNLMTFDSRITAQNLLDNKYNETSTISNTIKVSLDDKRHRIVEIKTTDNIVAGLNRKHMFGLPFLDNQKIHCCDIVYTTRIDLDAGIVNGIPNKVDMDIEYTN